MHKVFVSFHHGNDQWYKDELLRQNEEYQIFHDRSVDTGDIPDDQNLSSESIREIIRDDYLRDSTVTILLVGAETMKRKHVDWELYSSMVDGKVNKKSGIIVVNLPSVANDHCYVGHAGEKEVVHPEVTSWKSINTKSEFESRHPFMPNRIIDNLSSGALISVLDWKKINHQPQALRFLINAAYDDRAACVYNFSRRMRRGNS